MHVLFKTIHGSRLYGLSHDDSDYDYYTVVDKVKNAKASYSTHKIVDGVDSVVVDFGTWVHFCMNGVPQACEAMFSEVPEVDEIKEFREGFVLNTGAGERYLRTITNFCFTQDAKRKRHGLRLALNMYDFLRTGRFNPRLTPNEVDFVTDYAQRDTDAVYAMAMNIALDRTPPGMIR